jgi:hypothetical protein
LSAAIPGLKNPNFTREEKGDYRTFVAFVKYGLVLLEPMMTDSGEDGRDYRIWTITEEWENLQKIVMGKWIHGLYL